MECTIIGRGEMWNFLPARRSANKHGARRAWRGGRGGGRGRWSGEKGRRRKTSGGSGGGGAPEVVAVTASSSSKRSPRRVIGG